MMLCQGIFFYSSITFLISTYSCLAESVYREDLECLTKNKNYTKSIKRLADEACNAFENFETNKSDRALRVLLYTLSCGKAPFEVGVPQKLLSFQGIGGGATYCDYQIVTWILEKTYNLCKESFNWINQYGENADFINFYKRYLDIVNYKISKEELEKAIKIAQQKKEEERNKKERQYLECLTKNKNYTKSIKRLADEACNAFENFETNKSDRALRILLYTLSCGKAPFEVGVPQKLLSFQGIGGGATYCDYQIVLDS